MIDVLVLIPVTIMYGWNISACWNIADEINTIINDSVTKKKPSERELRIFKYRLELANKIIDNYDNAAELERLLHEFETVHKDMRDFEYSPNWIVYDDARSNADIYKGLGW